MLINKEREGFVRKQRMVIIINCLANPLYYLILNVFLGDIVNIAKFSEKHF